MAERLISCDDHMDLSQLPADLWTTRLPQGRGGGFSLVEHPMSARALAAPLHRQVYDGLRRAILYGVWLLPGSPYRSEAGAIHAAQWLAGKKPGLYGMKDVLGL